MAVDLRQTGCGCAVAEIQFQGSVMSIFSIDDFHTIRRGNCCRCGLHYAMLLTRARHRAETARASVNADVGVLGFDQAPVMIDVKNGAYD